MEAVTSDTVNRERPISEWVTFEWNIGEEPVTRKKQGRVTRQRRAALYPEKGLALDIRVWPGQPAALDQALVTEGLSG